MALIEGWLPPTREHYELILTLWTFFPLAWLLQFIIPWYGMGKTSYDTFLNVPGRAAWMIMESPAWIGILYMMNTLPAQEGITDLPWQNKVLAGLFLIHYSYRAFIYPLIAPSVGPTHVLIMCFAITFQTLNSISLGSWLAAYGPTTAEEWRQHLSPFPTLQFTVGIAIFYVGLAANYYHDDELREIRRREMARQRKVAAQTGGVVKEVKAHYEIPQAGLFKIMLYPHYFVEWVEWSGFWLACGLSCAPARNFLINEIAGMLPRAVRGRRWYVQKFGAEKIGKKWAVIPGVW